MSKLRASEDVSGDHPRYTVCADDGTILGITHMSHSGHEIDPFLTSQMAKQLHVGTEEFRGVVECYVSRDNYVLLASQ